MWYEISAKPSAFTLSFLAARTSLSPMAQLAAAENSYSVKRGGG